ncbi:MAG: hypothetical protein KDA61_22150 [Planctomycetales bacterium]|nr:hypothetical protein [Planctomycetales bacterium]
MQKCASVLVGITLLLIQRASGEEARFYADCHLHLLNFLQGGEFYNHDQAFPGSEWGELEHQRYATLPAGERWRRISGLLRNMKRQKIDRAIVFGMPIIKKWSLNDTYERPDGYLDNESHVVLARDTDLVLASAVEDYRQNHDADDGDLERLATIAPFMCGFDPTDLGAVDLAVQRIQEYPGVWQGIGEVFLRHDDVTHLQLGERPRANHPAMLRVARFAGQFDLPVSIHQNIAPVSRPGIERPPVYLDELVDLFEYCQEDVASGRKATTFIWCHAGASRRVNVERLPYWIGEVLAAHGDHVYIDLSWVIWDNYIRHDVESWRNLIERYPRRFMLGSDVVGSGTKSREELSDFEPLLRVLKSETGRLVAHDNLCNLLDEMTKRRRAAGNSRADMAGVALSPAYRYPEYADMPRRRDDESFVRSRSEQLERRGDRSKRDERQ